MPFGWFRWKRKVEEKRVEPLKLRTTQKEPTPTVHRPISLMEEESKPHPLENILTQLHNHDWKIASHSEHGRHYFVIPFSEGHHHFLEVTPEPRSNRLRVRAIRVDASTSIQDAIKKLAKIADEYYGFEFDAKHSRNAERRELAKKTLERLSKIFREETVDVPENATADELASLLRSVALRMGRP